MEVKELSPASVPLSTGSVEALSASESGRVEWRRWIAVVILLGLLATSLTTLTEPIPRWFAAGALVVFLGLTLFRESSPAPSPLRRPADERKDARQA